MKQLVSRRLLALAVALGATLVMVAVAQATGSSQARTRATGATVALRKTAVGTILVDARGRTLYLFEKDRNGVSMCNSACSAFWPGLTSHGTPHAGKGVHQSLLRLARARNGSRQVIYGGHPLYTFIGDKRASQTSGEGLTDFGAEWYALAANGTKVERHQSGGVAAGNSSGGYGGYGG